MYRAICRMLGPYAAGSSPPTARIRAFFAHKCRCGLIATSPKSEKFPASTNKPLTRNISNASGTACGRSPKQFAIARHRLVPLHASQPRNPIAPAELDAILSSQKMRERFTASDEEKR